MVINSALANGYMVFPHETIDNLKGEYTIMIIAHRLSTIINCNEIYMLEDGHITSCGTHNELLKSSKNYKKLYESEITGT